MGLSETAITRDVTSYDLNSLTKEELVIEIIRQADELDRVKKQRHMLQMELLNRHRGKNS